MTYDNVEMRVNFLVSGFSTVTEGSASYDPSREPLLDTHILYQGLMFYEIPNEGMNISLDIMPGGKPLDVDITDVSYIVCPHNYEKSRYHIDGTCCLKFFYKDGAADLKKHVVDRIILATDIPDNEKIFRLRKLHHVWYEKGEENR